jgi:hypothetical protein
MDVTNNNKTNPGKARVETISCMGCKQTFNNRSGLAVHLTYVSYCDIVTNISFSLKQQQQINM